MAIGKVAGPSLFSDLDRQGIDLQITTNGNPLLYLDFANFRAAINANALNTSATFTVNGNVSLDGISIDNTTVSSAADITLAAANELKLGHISKIKIDGGSPNYLMTTDGLGNLTWKNINTICDELDLTGNNVNLGTPTDGSLVDYSAYRYWTEQTSLADAIDNLNQVMLNVYQDTYVGRSEFTANVVAGPSPLTVSFTSTVLGNPTSYLWEFGDGMTSTEKDPTHTFSNQLGGQYSVYFKASNPAGTRSATGRLGDGHLAQGSYADNLKNNYITLYTPLPIPSFTLDTTSIDSGNSVILTNTSQFSDSYVIHWGDGTISTVSNNSVAGGVSGGPIGHVYNNTAGDSVYSITVDAYSYTAGPSGETVTSAAETVKVFSAHLPQFVANKSLGNNQHNTVPYGLNVTFTNTTTTSPGITSVFTNNKYRWNWGDGTYSEVTIGIGAAGDVGHTIVHAFALVDPKVEQTFNVTLEVDNGHSSSPFVSGIWPVTVIPAATALFSGANVVISDRIGDDALTGYLFTDLLGQSRNGFNFTNTSINADTYTWNFGDGYTVGPLNGSDTGGPAGPTLQHSYSGTGTFSVSLLAHGASSINSSDDTLLRSNYITIRPTPTPPDGLGTKTISITSIGTMPRLAANATNNTTYSLPAAGSAVTRITTVTPVETNEITDAYNAASGDLYAVINGVAEPAVSLTGNNDTGTYGSLVVTNDRDSHNISPTVYPSNFYTVFSGKLSRTNSSVPVGYNSYQINHSSTGNTNLLTFVKDNLTQVPTIDTTLFSASTVNLGTPKYISGVPYFNTGGVIALHDINVFNWIGQTYLGSTSPMAVTASTTVDGSGSVIIAQGKTYANLDMAGNTFLSGGVPIANTGRTSGTAYTLGPVPVSINSVVNATGTIAIQLSNVNGQSVITPLPTKINVYAATSTGVDELDIPVSVNLGGSYTDNGKRVKIASAVGATPTFVSTTNYYTSAVFSGAVPMAGTDEAVVRFGTLSHNTTNYSAYLPQGPDCSGRAGTQYFRFAFRRSQVANFTITYSGKISGLYIAAPNTIIDATSSLNKWLNASLVYAGAGVPGENTAAGGNGSNGCAKSSGDVVPVGQLVTNRSCVLTLGSANSSDAYGNQIFVSIALAAGDSITSISVS